MMKLLHCVLIMLNILFVTSHNGLKQSLLKTLANENNLKNIKTNIDNGDAEESNNVNENGLKHFDIVLINALNRNIKSYKNDKNVKTKDIKKDVENGISDDDGVLIYDNIERGRPVGRTIISNVGNFLNHLSGNCKGNVKIMNRNIDGPCDSYETEEQNKSEAEFGSEEQYGSEVKHWSNAQHGSNAQYASNTQHGSNAQHVSKAQYAFESQYGSDKQHGSNAQYGSNAQHGSNAQYGSNAQHGSNMKYRSHSQYGSGVQYGSGTQYGSKGRVKTCTRTCKIRYHKN